MSNIYERKAEYWTEDLADRGFEQVTMAALDALGWKYEDNTHDFEQPDICILTTVRRKQVRVALELKDKRQQYRARWAELARVPEPELLVVDEVSVRKLLAHAPRAFLVFWDRTRTDRPYVLYTIIDLFCAPKTRVQRPIALNSERLKGKWLLDARHGHSFGELNHIFASVANYLAHGMLADLRRLETHGPFIDEKVETLVMPHRWRHWSPVRLPRHPLVGFLAHMPASLILALCLFLLPWIPGSPPPVAAQSSDRLVLAFYYNWFDENSWGGKVPDQPISPYVSRDPGVMGRQIDEAKGAGIDAFVVNWYGPRVENNQTETNFRVMLDEAAAHGFRLALDVDMNSPFLGSAADVQAALSTLLSTHAQHPAYLRSGGKPVIFFYHQTARFGLGTWADIRAQVDPNHDSLWIEEGVDVSPLSVFDGHHLYSVTWANRTDMAYTADKFARLVRDKAAALGTAKVYVATVMPGYDDRKTGRGGAFAVDREGGAYYERSWRAAIDSGPDWIVINSYNEWPEGTFIEPSQACGNRYLDLTATWAAAFHNASPPPAPPPTEALAPTAVPDEVASKKRWELRRRSLLPRKLPLRLRLKRRTCGRPHRYPRRRLLHPARSRCVWAKTGRGRCSDTRFMRGLA